MKIIFALIGKTTEDYLIQGMAIYENRLKNYVNLETIVLPEPKKISGMGVNQQKVLEGQAFLKIINDPDMVYLLDERGKSFTSLEFSDFFQKNFLQSAKRLVFIIGGPFGFSEELYNRADDLISLSKMTFPHQMVRLFFLEQLYRAMNIMKNEKYHH